MEAQFAKFGLAENYRRYAAVEGREPAAQQRIVAVTWRARRLSLACRGDHAGRDIRTADPCSGRRRAALALHPTGDRSRHPVRRARQDGHPFHRDPGAVRSARPEAVQVDLRRRRRWRRTRSREAADHRSRVFKFAGATSYVVNPKSVPKLLEIYNGEWDRGPGLPIDILMRQEVHAGRLRADCAFPS